MGKMLTYIGIALFPVGFLNGFVGIAIAKPGWGAKTEFFAALLTGTASCLAVLVPLMLAGAKKDKQRLENARTAKQSGDWSAVYENVLPLLKWTTCTASNRDRRRIHCTIEVGL